MTTLVSRPRAGFSLIEVLVALVVFNVGVLALAAASAGTIRLLSEGRLLSRLTNLATDRLEILRLAAAQLPGCGGVSGGSLPAPQGISETWTVSGTGRSRAVEIILAYHLPGHTHADTLDAVLSCR